MLGIEFQAQPPYKTWSLEIRRELDFAVGTPIPESERQRANDICKAFEAAGWEIEKFAAGTVCPTWTISKNGAALFNEWAPDEFKTNMAEARKILQRKFGITGVKKYKLTLADMM